VKLRAEWDGNDGEDTAGEGEAGVGTATAAVSESEGERASTRGVVTCDATGDRHLGCADRGVDGFHGEDGFSNGTVGTGWEDHLASAGEDGSGDGMRHGVRAGSVAPFVGGSGDGTCGTGVVEEEVHGEKDRGQGSGVRGQGLTREQRSGVRDQGSENKGPRDRGNKGIGTNQGIGSRE